MCTCNTPGRVSCCWKQLMFISLKRIHWRRRFPNETTSTSSAKTADLKRFTFIFDSKLKVIRWNDAPYLFCSYCFIRSIYSKSMKIIRKAQSVLSLTCTILVCSALNMAVKNRICGRPAGPWLQWADRVDWLYCSDSSDRENTVVWLGLLE